MMYDRYYDQHRLFNNQIDSEAVTIANRRPYESEIDLTIVQPCYQARSGVLLRRYRHLGIL